MGYMPEKKLLFLLSYPIVISMLVQSIYNVVDSIFVSKISEDALTAVSLAFPIQNLMIAVGVGTGVGVNAILSRYLGMKERKKASDCAVHGLFLSFVNYMIFVIGALFFLDFFFRVQTDNEVVLNYAKQYTYIICYFSLGVFVQIMCERLLQSTGRTVYTMFTQMSGALINIILDPIFIFGLFGFPKMGIKGAAVATVIGQISGALLGLILNSLKNKDIKIDMRHFHIEWKMIRHIYSVGFPAIVMMSIGSIMIFMMNKILIKFSSTAVAVLGVLFKLQSFVFMPLFGVSNGMIPIIAYNYGAKNKKRIKTTIKIAIVTSTIMVFGGFLIFQLMPQTLLSFFDAGDNMRKIGINALRIVSLSYLVVGYSIVAISVFQALGHAMMSLVESFLRQVIVLIPVAYLLSRLGRLEYVWFSFIIAEIVSTLLCIYFMKKIYREEIDVLETIEHNI